MGARIEALVAAIARKYGLSHAALNALAVVEGNGGPIATGEVSERMHITSGTMTSVLDTLERDGYIRRLADPDDRRRVLVDITPDAQDVLNRMLPDVQQLAADAMAVFDDAVIEDLLETLAEVQRSLSSLPEPEPPKPRRTPSGLRRT